MDNLDYGSRAESPSYTYIASAVSVRRDWIFSGLGSGNGATPAPAGPTQRRVGLNVKSLHQKNTLESLDLGLKL